MVTQKKSVERVDVLENKTNATADKVDKPKISIRKDNYDISTEEGFKNTLAFFKKQAEDARKPLDEHFIGPC
jgi:hypothetical protein